MKAHAIIFDTETTTSGEDKEIIQAAWISVVIKDKDGETKLFPNNENGVSSFSQMYKPQEPISMGAMATHHIMDEDLLDMPPSSTFALPENLEYMIGHKVEFDWEACGSPAGIKLIDTLPIARLLWPDCDSHSQVALMYYLDRENARANTRDAHSADVDVRNCAKIVGKILEKVPNIKNFDDLYALSEYCKIPTVMPFGKHEGIEIKDVPQDYKEWLLKKDDVDPYLVRALSGEVKEKIDLLDGVDLTKKSVKKIKI